MLLLHDVDDLDYFRNLMLGHSSWKTIYDSSDTALNQKLETFEASGLKKVKYNLYNFYPRIQVH